jgi:hypothetical protein
MPQARFGRARLRFLPFAVGLPTPQTTPKHGLFQRWRSIDRGSWPTPLKLHRLMFTAPSMLPTITPSRLQSDSPELFLGSTLQRQTGVLKQSLKGELTDQRRSTPVLAVQIVIERIGFWWCKLIHDAPMWPISGRYECRTCGRHHPVLW